MEPTETSIKNKKYAIDLNEMSLSEFAQFLRETRFPRRLLELARDEDLGADRHDWTGELMFAPEEQRSVVMRSRASGIVSGLEFLADLVELFTDEASGKTIVFETFVEDGQPIAEGTELVKLVGNAQAIVALERTMLNLISRMSGIATRTSDFVQLVAGTRAKVCDTRKTTPGLRSFEKYAVRCGGGTTHRLSLNDAVLIKDNHIAGVESLDLATRIEQAASTIESDRTPIWFIQVEVDSLDQLSNVLKTKPGVVEIVLLDNMTNEQLALAVQMRDDAHTDHAQRVLLEASGGVTESSVPMIAECGVDRISIGGLTHQAQSLDIGLDMC
jgi:nicotinate-nucleotide pyrophosphorylase (carboxylating)